MAEAVAHIVRVLTDSRDPRVWLAFAPPDEAITRVLDAVPEGWAATVLPGCALSPADVSALHIGPGDIREISSRGD
ncbi:hypothetical protein [Bradyrhizobium guangzhouense]|uniref:hypothetical protein n=1 Tax=Bradyrhizobium guangzhouense TaxID=1325095 RepID=UPI001009DB28|nr:hypothetical protein [Bradyrhizobium guangzhouense]